MGTIRGGGRGALLGLVSVGAALGAVIAAVAGVAGLGDGDGGGAGGSRLVAATIVPTGRTGDRGRVAAATTTRTSKSSGTASTTSATSTTTTTATSAVVLGGPCLTLYGPGRTPPLVVNTTSRAITMTWWHNGDPAAIAYWVGVQPGGFVPVTSTTATATTAATNTTATATTAATNTTATDTMSTNSSSSGGTSLTEKPITWTKVTPPAGCRNVTFTVPGVVAGVNYSLWLEFEARTPEMTPDHARVFLNRVGGVHLE